MKKIFLLIGISALSLLLMGAGKFDKYLGEYREADTSTATAAKNTLNLISISSANYTDKAGDYACEGTGSDQTTFATAIAAMEAGDTLVVYPGTYTFSDTLTIDKSINLEGVDRSLCIIQATGNYDLISVTASGCTFKYLSFIATAGQTETTHPLFSIGADKITIASCFFNGNFCMKLGYAYQTIADNYFLGGVGIDMSLASPNSTTWSVIERNLFGTAGSYITTAITCSTNTCSYMVISENIIKATNAIAINGTSPISDITIINNNIFGAVKSISIENYHADRILINDNTVETGAVAVGLDLNGITNSQVCNNIIKNPTANYVSLSNDYDQPCTNNSILGNRGIGSASGGITEADANQDYNTYSANSCGTVTIAGAHSVNRDVVTISDSDRSTGWTSTTLGVSQRAAEQAFQFYAPEYVLVERVEVVASGAVSSGKVRQLDGNQTSITFSNLNGDVDRRYKIKMLYANGYAGVNNVMVNPRGDNTAANYNQEYLYSNNTTPYAGIDATATGLTLTWSNMVGITTGTMEIWAKSGTVRLTETLANAVNPATQSYNVLLNFGMWGNTADNIDSLVINAPHDIGVGSYIELYKLSQ
jgi:hypothetical protein